MKKFWKNEIILYAISLAILLVLLRFIEYQYLIRFNATELYIGAIAILFTGLGIWAGRKLTGKKEVIKIVETKVHVPTVELDPGTRRKKIEEFSISERELQVLELIEKGYSNQQIASELFVSLSSVKTYTTRLFQKLNVERRTQAIQKAKQEGILT